MAQNLSFKEEPLDEQKLVNIVDSLENEGLKENDELVFENENPSAKNILPVINIPEVTSNVEEKVDLENNKKELQEIKINTETLQNEIKEQEKKNKKIKKQKKQMKKKIRKKIKKMKMRKNKMKKRKRKRKRKKKRKRKRKRKKIKKKTKVMIVMKKVKMKNIIKSNKLNNQMKYC